MSLMEAEEKNGDLFIDPVFDKNQMWIWTSDRVQDELRAALIVGFSGGYCGWDYFEHNGYVRAVRFGQLSPE